MKNWLPVSVHGGHSGQFCNHARDSLEAIVRRYIGLGYPWVGITEHMPPVCDAYLYPEERKAGLTARAIYQRFGDYMTTCRHLQQQYADQICLYVGFETEMVSGSLDLAKRLTDEFTPDYVVGSVHHVHEIPFDYSPDFYQQAATRCNGTDELYLAYFDSQYEMIRHLRPQVVGHMDLIRIFDPNYASRLTKPDIWQKVVRNLELVKQLDLILDFNLRPLTRNEKEPYLSEPILKQAVAMQIDIVPGDDSHGTDDIGVHMQTAFDRLQNLGQSGDWRRPAP